jgi:glutamate N-acetyltransferase / amino-acid N-acetyltransferase
MKDLPVSPLAPENLAERFAGLPPVAGVEASCTRIGLYRHERNELLVVRLPAGTAVAGALTRSSTRSADVEWCAAALAGGRARMLVAHAGNSNAFTGAAGLAKNAATVAEAVAHTGCAPHEVFLSATGVIGVPLPPRTVADRLPQAMAALAPPEWEAMARTIGTTDTFPKGAGTRLDLGDGVPVAITGIAKGSGMIAPDMATMLVYVFTDAAVAPDVLQGMVSAHVETTFNAITVDSDTSTSDTLLVFATGASGTVPIDSPDDPRAGALSAALHGVMHDLALQVVRDGEGASKLVQITVEGAVSDASARTIALAIANSPLVKTAIAGEDANWGRVVMAVGKSGEPVDVAALAVRFGPIWTARDGGAVAYDVPAIDALMRGQEIDVGVVAGAGSGRATVWTCDLTHGYISINGDYRS